MGGGIFLSSLSSVLCTQCVSIMSKDLEMTCSSISLLDCGGIAGPRTRGFLVIPSSQFPLLVSSDIDDDDGLFSMYT